MGVFLDDGALFDHAVFLWRHRVPAYFYLSGDGPLPVAPYGTDKFKTPEAMVAR